MRVEEGTDGIVRHEKTGRRTRTMETEARTQENCRSLMSEGAEGPGGQWVTGNKVGHSQGDGSTDIGTRWCVVGQRAAGMMLRMMMRE